MRGGADDARLDVVELRGLRVRGRHGVLPAERDLGQVFGVDVTMHLDTRSAAASDDLADAVDYGAVAQAVHAVVAGEPVSLLETLAARVADAVLADHRVRAVDVALHKPSAPITVAFDDVVLRVHRASPWRRAVLSLGTNAGEGAATLASALRALDADPGVRVTATSPAYRTAPVGGVEQDDFLNAVVVVATALGPAALLALAHRVEAAHGRDRAREVRWGPRTLDVDLLTMATGAGDGEVVTSDRPARRGAEDPVLPHPRAHERAFVLLPWAAVAPDDVLPGHGRVADLAAALPDLERAGVRVEDRAGDRSGVSPAGEPARARAARRTAP